MMNYIWVGLVVIAVIAGAFTGTMEGVLNNIFDFANTAVEIALGFCGFRWLFSCRCDNLLLGSVDFLSEF